MRCLNNDLRRPSWLGDDDSFARTPGRLQALGLVLTPAPDDGGEVAPLCGPAPPAYNFEMTPSLCLQNEHADLELADESPQPRLALAPLDQVAATAFATGAVDQLLDQVRARAEILCGTDGPNLRLRLISKRLATNEVHVELLEALVGKALAARDFQALPYLEQLLRSFTGRLVLLRREHAEELRQRQRPTVVVRREVVSVQEG